MIKKITGVLIGAGLCSLLMAAPEEDDESKKPGGAGAFSVGVMWLDIEPLQEIVEDDLGRTGFEFDNNRFMTCGLMGYFGNRKNGYKIGYSGTFGYNTMYSDPWKSKSTDAVYIAAHPDSLVDSVIQLHNIIAHGGLLIERSFSFLENANFYAGGLIGGGVLLSIADERLATDAFNRVVFNDDNKDDDDDDDKRKCNCDTLSSRVAVAPLWVFDLHGGMTYTFTRWMHVGFDVSSTLYYSSTGFSYRQGSFLSINPGFAIRLTFGNSV